MMDWRDLRKIAFFAACSEPELRALAPLCCRSPYRKAQSIHEENSPVQKAYAVMAGDVLLYRSGAGHTSRLAVVKSGEMFGIGEVLLPTYYTSASALTACTLLEIGKEDFIRRFLAVPAFRERVVLELSKIARFLICKVTGGGGRNDLALYLRTQAEKSGKISGDRIRIQEKLRQPEIASLLNLSREHVTRLFARLKTEGLADFNRGFPIINRAWLDQAVRDKDLAASIQYRDARFEQ
jgi:CRP-like cAMP-binding protein